MATKKEIEEQGKLAAKQANYTKKMSEDMGAFVAGQKFRNKMEQGKIDKAAGIDKDAKEARSKQVAILKNISLAEQKRQEDFDADIKARESSLEKLGESIGKDSGTFKKANKALEEEKAAEEARREKQGQNMLGRIAKGIEGISGKFKDFVGETPTALKAILAGVAFFALAKFLKSPQFQKITSFIVDSLLPALKDFFDDIMKFDFELTGENGLISLIKNNFGVIIGALAILKPKLLFNLAKFAFMGLFNGIKFMYMDMQKNAFGGRFMKTKRLLSLFRIRTLAVASGFGKAGNMLGGKMTKAMGFLKTGVGKVASGFGKTGAMLGGPISKAMGFLKAGVGFMTKGLAFLGKGILSLGKALLFNPIGLIILAIVGIVAAIVYYFDDIKSYFEELGGFAGIFSRVIANIKDALAGVANKFITAYNFVTNSDVPLFETGRAEANAERIEKENVIKKQADAKKKAEADTKKKQDDLFEEGTMGSDLPAEKQLTAGEIQANAIDKLFGIMKPQSSPIIQTNVNNSKVSNAKNVTSKAVSSVDTDPIYQITKNVSIA